LFLYFASFTLAAYGFGQQQPYRSESVRFHDGSLEVEGPLTDVDWNEINKRTVHSVHMLCGSEVPVFENRNCLKGMREVILLSSSDNARSLRDLSNNYPNIEELAVSQVAPITEADIQCIHRFNHLFFLEVCNDTPPSFSTAIPPTLQRLLLEDTSITAAQSCRVNLPVLTNFSLRRSKLSKGFLAGLNAPELEEVSLSRVWAEPDAFKLFSRFPKLQRIFAYNMPQSAQVDLAQLQTLNPKLKIVVASTSGAE
jgi:hypothetical protein